MMSKPEQITRKCVLPQPNRESFVDAAILQLTARLEGKDFLAGNWSLRELVERLEQVGVAVEVQQEAIGGK